MKILSVILVLLLCSCSRSTSKSEAAKLVVALPIYYVDCITGSDSNSGLSTLEAWKSLGKVAQVNIQPGSKVLFKRGCAFRGEIIPRAGASDSMRVTYSDYGDSSEPRPVILGSVELNSTSDWISDSTNIWKANQTSPIDIGNIIFNNSTVAVKKWTKADLAAQGDFFYDLSSDEVFIYSTSNPALFYADLELCLRRAIVENRGVNYITYENLHFAYSGGHAVWVLSSVGINVLNSQFSYIGGGDLDQDGSNIRFGNAVEFLNNAKDGIVSGNIAIETYDTAWTAQGTTASGLLLDNIKFYNNVSFNSGYSCGEFWNKGTGATLSNIYFENNTCFSNGSSWGAAQRSSLGEAHLILDDDPDNLSNIVVRNNIFSGGNVAIFIKGTSWLTNGALSLDYNNYYNFNVATVRHVNALVTDYDLSAWQAAEGLDLNTLSSNPEFVSTNAASLNLRLNTSSPSKGTGIANEVKLNFDGVSRPPFGRGAY